MKPLLYILLLLCLDASAGQRIFFAASAHGGSDANTGTQASPYGTIAKYNAISGTLTAGDTVFFFGGDVFTGTLNFPGNGSTGNPVVFTSYNGGKAIISGFASLNTWTNLGGNIWQSSTVDSGLYMDVLIMNAGTFVPMGRTPNTGSYFTIQSHTNPTANTSAGFTGQTFTSSDVPTGINWVGARAYMRINPYNPDINAITAQSGTTLSFASKNGNIYNDYNNNKFFLQNHLSTLTYQNEWYYDPLAKVVKMFSSTDPGNFGIRVGQYNFAMRIDNETGTNSHDITFRNLIFQGQDSCALLFTGVTNTAILNCEFYWIGANAVAFLPANDFGDYRNRNVTFVGNKIRNAGNNGFYSRFTMQGNIVTDNDIDSCGAIEGFGLPGNKQRVGINIEYPDGNNEGSATDSVLILRNIVKHTGYCGIIHQGGFLRVMYNLVDTYGMQASDGGGIYCSRNSGDSTANRRKIWYNIVLNGFGNNAAVSGAANGGMPGIYCDDRSTMLDIRFNCVYTSTRYGIFLHNNNNITVNSNNILGVTQDAAIGILYDGLEPGFLTRGIDVQNNSIYASPTYSLISMYSYIGNDLASFGVINNNYYSRPSAQGAWTGQQGGTGITYGTLTDWTAGYGYDANSTFKSVNSDSVFIFYNATLYPVTNNFSGNTYKDLQGNIFSNSLTLQPFQSRILMKVTFIPTSVTNASYLIDRTRTRKKIYFSP